MMRMNNNIPAIYSIPSNPFIHTDDIQQLLAPGSVATIEGEFFTFSPIFFSYPCKLSEMRVEKKVKNHPKLSNACVQKTATIESFHLAAHNNHNLMFNRPIIYMHVHRTRTWPRHKFGTACKLAQ